MKLRFMTYNIQHGADYRRRISPSKEHFIDLGAAAEVIRELDAQGVFTATYRLIDTGKPMYVNMKITRMPGGNHIIMGISVIDAQMKFQARRAQKKGETV